MVAVILLSVPALAGDLVAKKHTDKPQTAKEAADQVENKGAKEATAQPLQNDKPNEEQASSVDFDNGDKGCTEDHKGCRHYAVDPTPKPKIWCPVGFKVKNGVCNKDIFITVHKKVKTSTVDPPAPRYITGTLIDCNIVGATPTYFTQLAINSCNQQYALFITGGGIR